MLLSLYLSSFSGSLRPARHNRYVQDSCVDESKVGSKSIQFTQHKVDILLLDGRVRYDATEKVWRVSERLIADHQRPRVHHLGLELGSDLST